MFDLLATLAFAAMSISRAQASLPANCVRNATVAPGDVCNAISSQYNVSTYQILEANEGRINQNCTNLYPGEVICLGLKGQDCNTTFVVESGISCGAIAIQFDIPYDTLLANNPNVNSECSNIYNGEVLCVSGTIYDYNSTGSS